MGLTSVTRTLTSNPPKHPPGTPRIYSTSTLFTDSSSEEITGSIELHHSLNDRGFYQRLSSGTLTIGTPYPSTSKHTLPQSATTRLPSTLKFTKDHYYGAGAQRHLAHHGFAPDLYGTSTRPGAPTAYIMQDLGPGWVMLFYLDIEYHYKLYGPYDSMGYVDDWESKHAKVLEFKEAIWASLQAMLDVMEAEGIVHGELRSNDIVVKLDEHGDPVLLDLDLGVGKKRKRTVGVELKLIGPERRARFGILLGGMSRLKGLGGLERLGVD
ncbi:hypothetical protein AX16_005077 [Volvariella volvacea WC 439]|nr:hypothetical protein AX16_005077 [Volvariella volvacea WC 439]